MASFCVMRVLLFSLLVALVSVAHSLEFLDLVNYGKAALKAAGKFTSGRLFALFPNLHSQPRSKILQV